jgi:hypothetical protein
LPDKGINPRKLLNCSAFDLIELNGDDLRRDTARKATLTSVLAEPAISDGGRGAGV